MSHLVWAHGKTRKACSIEGRAQRAERRSKGEIENAFPIAIFILAIHAAITSDNNTRIFEAIEKNEKNNKQKLTIEFMQAQMWLKSQSDSQYMWTYFLFNFIRLLDFVIIFSYFAVCSFHCRCLFICYCLEIVLSYAFFSFFVSLAPSLAAIVSFFFLVGSFLFSCNTKCVYLCTCS